MRALGRSPVIALVVLVSVAALAVVGTRSVLGAGSRQMATFAEILALIEERHVPDADPKDVIYASVHGMLQTLDPHTSFLDDEAYREMREEQRGSFFGLGIVISKAGRYQPLRVVSPIADTPADRMGIRAGDVISHIRDERADVDIDTLGLTIQEAVGYLRGPRNTPVEITIDRPGLDEPLTFVVERDAIRTPAVNRVFLIRPEVGYVQVANFTETTSSELDEAVDTLREQGATKLVLDLRGNPGGLLDQAIGVASRFLEPGELVVFTEGRLSGSRQDYNSRGDVPQIDWPVVAIIDAGSASASEIVAGALQDHDRGLLVGTTTFGKGLVQSVYPLSENTGLALTTQKYYSPSGRTIQRSYETEEEYFFDARAGDVELPDPDDPIHRSATGRPIRGGGGVKPDIRVKNEDAPRVIVHLSRVSAFSRFISGRTDAQRSAYADDPSLMLPDFKTFLADAEPTVEPAAIDEAADRVTLFLAAELALARNGMRARDRVLLDQDDVVNRAIESLDDAEALLAARRRHLAERRAEVRAGGSRRR